MRSHAWLRSSALAAVFALALVPFAHAVPDKEADEAVKTFKKAYATKDDKARQAAVKALAPVQHRWVAEALEGPLGKDTAAAVRVEAAKAIGGQWTFRAAEILVAALKGDEEIPHDVLLAIVDALGETESDAAVPSLVDFLVTQPHLYRNNKAPPSEVAATTAHAVAALKRTGSSKAVPALIDFVETEVAAKRGGKDALMGAADTALASLTGQKLRGAKAWREWWNANSETEKTWKVYRCEQTGKVWDKVAGDTHCPSCPDKQNLKCSVFLRTRFVDSTTGDEPTKKK